MNADMHIYPSTQSQMRLSELELWQWLALEQSLPVENLHLLSECMCKWHSHSGFPEKDKEVRLITPLWYYFPLKWILDFLYTCPTWLLPAPPLANSCSSLRVIVLITISKSPPLLRPASQTWWVSSLHLYTSPLFINFDNTLPSLKQHLSYCLLSLHHQYSAGTL